MKMLLETLENKKNVKEAVSLSNCGFRVFVEEEKTDKYQVIGFHGNGSTEAETLTEAIFSFSPQFEKNPYFLIKEFFLNGVEIKPQAFYLAFRKNLKDYAKYFNVETAVQKTEVGQLAPTLTEMLPEVKTSEINKFVFMVNDLYVIRYNAPPEVIDAVLRPLVLRTRKGKDKIKSMQKDLNDLERIQNAFREQKMSIDELGFYAKFLFDVRSSDSEANGFKTALEGVRENLSEYIIISFIGKNSGYKNVGFLSAVALVKRGDFLGLQINSKVDRVSRNKRDIYTLELCRLGGVYIAVREGETLVSLSGDKKLSFDIQMLIADHQRMKIAVRPSNGFFYSKKEFSKLNAKELKVFTLWAWNNQEHNATDSTEFLEMSWDAFKKALDDK